MLNLNLSQLDQQRRNFLIILLGFLIFFLELFNFLPLNFLKEGVARWQAANYQLVQVGLQPLRRFLSLWNLTEKLADLQDRYSSMAATVTRLENIERENQELRQLLENSDRKIGSSIVTTPIISFSQTVLPVGEQDGVLPGALVLYRNNLLARVSTVERRQSKITLLQQMTEGGILAETESGVKGLIKGNGFQILLTEINSDQQLRINELVTTVGQEGVEKGLLIGEIRALEEENPAKASKTAVVEPLLNFYQLNIVEVK